MRNRKDDDLGDSADEESHFIDKKKDEGNHHYHDKKESYNYFPVIRNLFYATIASFILVILDMKEPPSIRTPLLAFSVNSTSVLLKNDNSVATKNDVLTIPLSVPDKCLGQWTSDRLVGRCFGLKNHVDYPSLKDITLVADADHCKSLCCDLGKDCVSWQFWVGIKLCKLGGPVRVGGEAAPTPNWCEPEPPLTWTGRKVSLVNGTRVESGEELTTQCFGLGPQKYRSEADTKHALTVLECPAACLADPKCSTWQAHQNRGCFYSSSPSVYCEPYSGVYEGGRKISRAVIAAAAVAARP